jgi:hypothetical protein
MRAAGAMAIAFAGLIAVAAPACAAAQGSGGGGAEAPRAAREQPAGPNQLTAAERAAGWKLLFDGTTLNGWRQYRADTLPTAWGVADGTITKNVGTRDIITRDQYGDFELVFEWRIGTGGNAGVFYRATEEYDRVYWSAPEYQLLDDPNAGREGRNRFTAAAASYGVDSVPPGIVKPAGEWNQSRIIAHGAHVEHWLNGRKVVEQELWSPAWEAKVKASKFAEWANYGRAKRGHIALQGDHRGDLALRNIKIREVR